MAGIVDYLNSKGQPSDYASRLKLAKQLGINGYIGSESQNTDMLNILNNDKGSSTSSSNTTGNKPTGKTSTGNSDSKPAGIEYNPQWSSYGVTQDTWGKLSPLQQAQVSIVMSSALNSYAANASSLPVSDALRQAANDPTIVSKYSDALGLDTAAFTDSLANAQTALSTTEQQQKIQFEKDRKALAENAAATGTAYSGFREQAKKNLETTESGIVTSTRSQAQSSLNQARQNFESKYGTAATPTASLTYNNPLYNGTNISGGMDQSATTDNTITGNTVGNVLGSQNVAKNTDVTNLALNNIGLSSPVSVTAIK